MCRNSHISAGILTSVQEFLTSVQEFSNRASQILISHQRWPSKSVQEFSQQRRNSHISGGMIVGIHVGPLGIHISAGILIRSSCMIAGICTSAREIHQRCRTCEIGESCYVCPPGVQNMVGCKEFTRSRRQAMGGGDVRKADGGPKTSHL